MQAGEFRMGFVGLDIHRGEGQDSRIGKSQRQRHIRWCGRWYAGDRGSCSGGFIGQQGQV